MIIIKSLFNVVCIPDQMEYAVYTKDYCLDEEGNICEDLENMDVYEYGDLIIETPQKRYMFQKTYAAYDYCARITEEIKKQRHNPVIYVEMETLNDNWNCHRGTFVVTSL